jgi:hypothetical protein
LCAKVAIQLFLLFSALKLFYTTMLKYQEAQVQTYDSEFTGVLTWNALNEGGCYIYLQHNSPDILFHESPVGEKFFRKLFTYAPWRYIIDRATKERIDTSIVEYFGSNKEHKEQWRIRNLQVQFSKLQ